MGSPHPKAGPAASQEGSGNLHELFKKEGFSWRFEAGMNGLGTIVASIDGALDRFLAKSRTPCGAGRYTAAGFGAGRAVRPADADGDAAARRAGCAGVPCRRQQAVLQKPAGPAGPGRPRAADAAVPLVLPARG